MHYATDQNYIGVTVPGMMTSETGLFNSTARKPITEKITKPAKKLVMAEHVVSIMESL